MMTKPPTIGFKVKKVHISDGFAGADFPTAATPDPHSGVKSCMKRWRD